MREWFYNLWNSASFFDRLLRVALTGAGTSLIGFTNGSPWLKALGAGLNAAAVFIPAGDKNAPVVANSEEVRASNAP